MNLSPHFDPDNPAHHTVPEWAERGPTANWWINAVAACLHDGQARVLLRMGNVLVLTYSGEGPLEVLELP
jgi:hypothetical protein